MTFDAKTITTEQKTKIDSELAKRGVKFLPGQVMRRIVGPAAPTLKVLGATVRAKSAKIAKRAAAQKAASAPAPAAPAKK